MRVRRERGLRRGHAIIVELAAYKAARHARDVLLQLLGPVSWLLRVDIEWQHSGAPRLVATIAGLDHRKNCCVPSHVDNVEVRTKDAAGASQP
jgi:hypothetical protein